MNEDLQKYSENLVKRIDRILHNNRLSITEKMELLTSASDAIRDKAIGIGCRDD